MNPNVESPIFIIPHQEQKRQFVDLFIKKFEFFHTVFKINIKKCTNNTIKTNKFLKYIYYTYILWKKSKYALKCFDHEKNVCRIRVLLGIFQTVWR